MQIPEVSRHHEKNLIKSQVCCNMCEESPPLMKEDWTQGADEEGSRFVEVSEIEMETMTSIKCID